MAGGVAGTLAGGSLAAGGGFTTAVSEFLVAKAYLAHAGLVPHALMAFLRDAYKRGVLRQIGGVYQFRHAVLRDRLADRHHA
ncbi:MAG: hypothetical protein HOV94_44090 [Saccharothrix sp.]|nr:hypothetical protein [Saccharothrix sp.]